MKPSQLVAVLLMTSPLAFAQSGKLDPQLGLLQCFPERVQVEQQRGSMIYKSAPTDRIEAIVTLSRQDVDLQSAGATTVWRRGDMAIVRIPADRLADLADLEGVLYVEAPQISRPQLDVSAPMIGADQVWNTHGITGQDVIVGVLDSGIDWQHPAFCREDGRTRIRCMLDLSETGNYYGGRLYDETDINTALQTGSGVWESDYSGHGTHVAGIIAGNGRSDANGGVYTGVAPEAELVVVKAARNDLGTEFRTSDQIIGLSFIDSVAFALSRPYVVNLSIGGHYGAHDGTSAVERFIDTLTGYGNPGKVVVTVAGNDGNDNIHAQAVLTSSAKKSITLQVSPYTPLAGSGSNYLQLSGWYTGTASIAVTVTTPGGQSHGPVRPEQVLDIKSPEGAVYVWNSFYEQNGGYRPGRNPFNNDREIYIEISNAVGAGLPAAGEWTIEFSGAAAVVDAYLVYCTMPAEFKLGKVDFGKLSIPGTSEHAITVGAYTSKVMWTDLDGHRLTISRNGANRIDEIAPFSSPGPTRSGSVVKPDITAPGQMIVSAVSRDAAPSSRNSIFYTGDAAFPNGYISTDPQYGLAGGTSQASPHVAGVCALLLQKNPDLTAAQVRELLARGAKVDAAVGSVPNNFWGHGKVDAARSISLQPGDDPFADIDNVNAFPNPFTQASGTTIVYRLPAERSRTYTTVRVFNARGQEVRTLVSAIRPNGLNLEPWDGRDDAGFRVAAGIYFVEIVSSEHRELKKLAFLGQK